MKLSDICNEILGHNFNFLNGHCPKSQDKWPLPLSLFRPVVEEEYQKEDPFISESPEEAYQKGTVDKIPWICGQAEDEGYTFLLCMQYGVH